MTSKKYKVFSLATKKPLRQTNIASELKLKLKAIGINNNDKLDSSQSCMEVARLTKTKANNKNLTIKIIWYH